MRVAILRIHKDEQSYNRYWQSQERLDMASVTGLFKSDIEGQIVHKARNEVVSTALGEEAWDVAFLMDDDMVYPPHAIVHAVNQLEKHPEISILSGLYFERRLPHTPQVYEEAVEPDLRGKYWPVVDYAERAGPDGLLQVDACGAGFLFVRRGVFEKLKRPWFVFLDRMGEDFYFCRKARAAGYQVWADVGLKAGHMGVVEIHEGVFTQVRPHLKRALPVEGDKAPSKEAYVLS